MVDAARTIGPHQRHIPGIDGLRGIAVFLVVAYHLDIRGFDGGFIGVDVFFVLSGFLITSLMLAEYGRDEGVDLGAFWVRRARRLLPALFVLLAGVSAIAWTLSSVSRSALRWDALTSLVYVQNWRFVATGQTYAAENTDPSLLGHLWSLSIEEQFYVIWPMLFVLLMKFGGQRRRQNSIAILTIAAIGSAAMLAAGFDRFDPSAVYFATHTRAFEPLAGATLAFVLAPRQFKNQTLRLQPATAGLMTVASVAAIVFAVTQFSFRDVVYYRGGAVAVTIATLLLVVVLTNESSPASRLFTTSPLVLLGNVSYGLYLWHWPVIVWLDSDRTGIDGTSLLLIQIAVFSAITALSYRFVEQPIRAGTFAGIRLTPAVVFRSSLVSILALVVLVPLLTLGAEPVPEYLAEDGGVRTVEPATPLEEPRADEPDSEEPRTDEPVSDEPDSVVTGSSDGAGLEPAAPQTTIGVIGDSIARSLAPGFEREANARGFGFSQATFGGCSVGQLLRLNADEDPFSNAQRCIDETAVAFDELVANTNPSLVIWYSQRERYAVELDGVVLRTGTEEWREAVFADWTSTLDRLTGDGATVALVLPAYGAGGSTSRCEGETPEAIFENPRCIADNGALQGGPLRAYYRQWAAEHTDRIVVVDATPIVCRNRDVCTTEGEELDFRPDDGLHFNDAGADVVAPLLLAEIESLLADRGIDLTTS